jgi:hypothetical protein
VWYSRRNLVPAQKWHNEIGSALARCDWFILVLSRHSVESKWVERELVYALRHRQYEGRIVPILKERCNFEKLSWTLGGFQVVDFVRSFDGGCQSLLRTWNLDYVAGRRPARKPRKGRKK